MGKGSKADRTDRPAKMTPSMENVKTSTAPEPFKITFNTWGEKKIKLKNTFSPLNDTDLHFVEGKESEITTRLRAKLGKSEAEVQKPITDR